MAKRFTQYDPFVAPALPDILLGVDVSDTTHSVDGTSKKITLQQIWDTIKDAEASEFKLITSAADFPAPVSGVITLTGGNTYFLTTNIDLGGDRIVCDGVVCLRGASSEVASLTSTGLTGGASLVTSAYSLPVQHLTFDGQNSPDFKILALDGLGNNAAHDWYGVNFKDCVDMGVIANCDNFVTLNGAFLNSAELAFDGAQGSIVFNTYFALGRTGGGGTLSIGRIRSTATVGTRFRMQYTTIIVPTGSIGLNVESAASFPNPESAVLEQVNFGGSGTPATAVLAGTNKSLFIRCNGVPNRACFVQYGMDGNTTETVITTADVAVPVAGTTTAYQNEKFIHTSGEVTYDGAFLGTLTVDVSAAISAPANNITVRLELWVDGGGGYALVPGALGRVRLPTASQPGTVSFPATVQALPGDKYKVYVVNETGTQNLTVTELSVRHIRTT